MAARPHLILGGREAPSWADGAVAGAAVLLNVLVALYVASAGGRGVALVLVALAVIPVVWVAAARPAWILYAALVVTMLGGTPNELARMLGVSLNIHLPAAGGTRIFPSDLIVVLAVTGATVRLLTSTRGEPRPRLRTIVLSWPFVLLVFALMHGVLRGHDRYGTSYISQPARIFAYAAIGFALVDERPANLLRNLTRIFYAVIVITTFSAFYYLATGKSQTEAAQLSTGGTRVLALSTSMFVAAGLVLALIHLELDPHGSRRRLHAWMAGLATFCVLISLGRTTFAAIGVLIPALVITLRRLRRTILLYAPAVVAVVVLAGAFMAVVAPHAAQTLGQRFTGKVGTDTAVVQRQRKYAATMQGFGRDPAFGLGFGRKVTFVQVDNTVASFSGDPEDSYIYILAGGGIVALTALLVLIGLYYVDVVRRFLRTVGDERALVVFGASLTFILLVNAISGPVLSNPPLMLLTWIGLLLPAAAGRGRPSTSA